MPLAGTGARAAAPTPPSAAFIDVELDDVIVRAQSNSIAGERVAGADIRAVYAELGRHPLWQVEPAAQARAEALRQALVGAIDQGVALEGLHLDALEKLQPATPRAIAERDVLLTDAALSYARKLRRGSVPDDALGEDWHIQPDPFDPVTALTQALRAGDVQPFLQSLAPAAPGYRALVAALGQYRALARSGGWAAIPAGSEVKLDGSDPRRDGLRARLAAEGYLDRADLDPAHLYAAVRQFQVRHGLDSDARVGLRTLAELNVSAAARAAQIAANLERWRHLPRRFGERYVAVNTADQSLDLIADGASRFHTRVIVGTPRRATPEIGATITGITFNPPWKIPPSIAAKEMLPRLKRDPGYLAANNIVIVGRAADPFGAAVDWRRISAASFPFRLQQIPGPTNSLGGLKLEMQNPWNVYLHDTPVKTLFARNERGFSHGCVRVQQPEELARHLLNDEEMWSAQAIANAVLAGDTRTVPLRPAVPVYLLYWTAFVDADGAVQFRKDIYGRDEAVERALGVSRAPERPRTAAAAHGGCQNGMSVVWTARG
jgi:L,D-transpeptidase YcbB